MFPPGLHLFPDEVRLRTITGHDSAWLQFVPPRVLTERNILYSEKIDTRRLLNKTH